MEFVLELLAEAGGGILKLLFGRWLDRDPDKEALKNALAAKEKEVKVMEAPPRPESTVDSDLLRHAPDQ